MKHSREYYRKKLACIEKQYRQLTLFPLGYFGGELRAPTPAEMGRMRRGIALALTMMKRREKEAM